MFFATFVVLFIFAKSSVKFSIFILEIKWTIILAFYVYNPQEKLQQNFYYNQIILLTIILPLYKKTAEKKFYKLYHVFILK